MKPNLTTILVAMALVASAAFAQTKDVILIGGSIAKETAEKWTQNFQRIHAKETYGSVYGKNMFTSLFSNKEVAGVFIFNGLDGDGNVHLVFKGADKDGNVMAAGSVWDNGTVCPPICPTGNIASIGKQVSEGMAQQWIENYQQKNSGRTFSHLYGKALLEMILSQPKAEGIYFANATDEKNLDRLVLVGVDAIGNIMWGGEIGDNGTLCPPNCPAGYPPVLNAEKKK
jgi:hypothetical protein